MANDVLVVVLTVLVAAAVVAVATRKVDDPGQVASWARDHGLVLTDVNVGLVRYFVRLVIVLRVTGGLGGWAVGASIDQALGTRIGDFWTWFIAGWVVGAWWADRSVALPGAPGTGALLAPRRLADYLPAYLRVAPGASAAVSVVLAVVGIVAPAEGMVPHRRVLAGWALAAVLVAVLAVLAQRSVVARPQPAHGPDLVAADDAVRANAVHHIAGGATAVTLLLMASVVAQPELGGSDSARNLFGLVAALAALLAWRHLSFRAWRVRRAGSAGDVGALGVAP